MGNNGENKVEEERLETVLKNRNSNPNPKCVTWATSKETQDVIEMNLSLLDDDDKSNSSVESEAQTKENTASENKPELFIISKQTEETCSTISTITPKVRNGKNIKKKKTRGNIFKKYNIMSARQ